MLISEYSYYPIYINLCLFLVIFTLLHTTVLKIDDKKNLAFTNFFGYLLLVFITLYIGQRPISHIFGDTVNYNFLYLKYQIGEPIGNEADYGWHVFMRFCAQIMSVNLFFTLVSIIYIFPMYRISKSFFGHYWYYAFFMFVVSFSFWSYGVNGIRNGAACSLFLLGISQKNNKIFTGICFMLAFTFHKTASLPILAYLLTFLYNKPKTYFLGWLACIPLSLILGGVWVALFASLGFADERLSAYLTGQAEEGVFKSTGFRWDFLFHSAFAVFAGWYFVVKRKFKDELYFHLLNTYLICNGFWILVIKANYSNRFAYLSWFMMSIIIIYPMLKKQFFKNQHSMVGNIVLVYFAFTYLMFYIYYN